MRCLSLSGLCWAKDTVIFILGTLTIMTVGPSTLFFLESLASDIQGGPKKVYDMI